MERISPFRYPRGKAVISEADAVDRNFLGRCFELHAGGTGAALPMRGIVSKIHLNDAGSRAFRHSAPEEPERFADRIWSVPLTIGERKKQREIRNRPWEHDTFDPGFAAFCTNRGSRVLIGGGRGGARRMGRQTLPGRIRRLAGLRDSVRLYRSSPTTMGNQHNAFLRKNCCGGSCRTTTAASSENRIGTASDFYRRFATPCRANGLRESSSSPRRTLPCPGPSRRARQHLDPGDDP